MPSRTLTVRLEVPYDTAYARLSDPATWSSWAAGLGAGLIRRPDGDWTVNTVAGTSARVRFSDPNPYGVLDHTVLSPGGAEVHVPMRLIPNGDGCELALTLLRTPTMDDAAFAADAAAVERDLAALKAGLER